eukprot:gene3799-4380_t
MSIFTGEVIQRPSNALKELIENSLDAGSTTITITVKDGGLKVLQIQDNGCGIKLEDMDIVCERFTTSKLTKFDDLRKISTFGFRGEALSSISHVSHLKILTKTADSPCAYRASYLNGKLTPATQRDTADPKPCAGVNGTTITSEDLFYNVASRKKVIKNTQEEHTRIVDLIKRYAINNPSCSFILKKYGETSPDVHTPGNLTEKVAISLLFGSEVGRELKELSSTDQKYEYTMKGYFSTTNYNAKKSLFILFINNCKNLKAGLEQLYARYLPKGSHPFMFVRLLLAPKNVDVNIHPTKSEVKFLYEEQIIESIQAVVDQELSQKNKAGSSTTFINPRRTKKYKPSELTSIKDLLKTMETNAHSGLKEFFSDCTFVGCLDHSYALSQHKTKLYLLSIDNLSKELVYQSVLNGFSNFDTIKFTVPLSIRQLLATALESPCSGWLPDDGPKDKIADKL